MQIQQATIQLKNLLSIVTTIFGLLIVVFLLAKISPIDPVLTLLGDSRDQATYIHAQKELGLDLSIHRQFVKYISKLLKGDFGNSRLTGNPVLMDIKHTLPATIELATVAIIFGVFLGVPLGIIAAMYKNLWPDKLLRICCLFGNSVSIFWLGLMSLWLFYATLDWIPEPGRVGIEFLTAKNSSFVLFSSLLHANWPMFYSAFGHLLLPASILAYYNLATISRMTRFFLLEQMQKEYILVGRMKGLSEIQLILRHALPNAAIPLLTIIILSYASLLEGSTLVENIFMWPGLGYYITQALLSSDINAILGCAIVVGSVFIVCNLATERLYGLLNPLVKS